MISKSAIPASDAASATSDSEVLVLDAHTLKDLEIFEAESGGQSLFRLCNLTRTQGGERVLERRMRCPWSNVVRIHAVHESLSFILAHRPAFDVLPSLGYATGRVERYLVENLPLVSQHNFVEFGFGVIDLKLNHDPDYARIVRGVQVACGLIRALRSFIDEERLSACAAGELRPLLEELRALLARPGLARVPDVELHDAGAWKILRIDQTFRLHERGALKRLLELIYEIDALVALADAGDRHDFVLPSLSEGRPGVNAEGLRHPLLQNAVTNPVALDQQRRVLFLTGPNMAGKTTYLRAIALAFYMAHLGMGVPAHSFHFTPAQRLFSSISLKDDLYGGVSYFRAEALRVKAVAEAIARGYRVFAVMDEPFKGTNVKDALDASWAILSRLATTQDCLFVFSSHLIELSEKLEGVATVDFRHFEAKAADGRLRFDYVVRSGVSSQRLGMRVLHEEGIFELLDQAVDVNADSIDD